MPIKEYKIKPRNGVYQKPRQIYEPEVKINTKAIKQDVKDTLTVEYNSHVFEADTTAINYMSAVISIANFKCNEALALGATAEDAYSQVYGQAIPWKLADKSIELITIEDVANTLQTIMNQIGSIVAEYS